MTFTYDSPMKGPLFNIGKMRQLVLAVFLMEGKLFMQD